METTRLEQMIEAKATRDHVRNDIVKALRGGADAAEIAALLEADAHATTLLADVMAQIPDSHS